MEELIKAADKLRAELSEWHLKVARYEWGNTNTEVVILRLQEYDKARAAYKGNS